MLSRSVNWLLIPLSVSSLGISLRSPCRTAELCKSNSYYHTSLPARMPRGVKKENLPSKDCIVCGRPFTWRKKWERCWDEVTTCSKSCNSKRRNDNRIKTEFQSKQSTPSYESMKNSDASEINMFTSIQHDNLNLKLSPNLPTEDIPGGLDMNLLPPVTDFQDDRDKPGSCINLSYDIDEISESSSTDDQKAKRKAAKKMMKDERRNQRQGLGDPTKGQKICDMCSRSVDLLIRCQYDESKQWKMVCGKCWTIASGGVVDGDANHPHYRYGGLWKNRNK